MGMETKSGKCTVKSGTSIIKEFGCMGLILTEVQKVERVNVCGPPGSEEAQQPRH